MQRLILFNKPIVLCYSSQHHCSQCFIGIWWSFQVGWDFFIEVTGPKDVSSKSILGHTPPGNFGHGDAIINKRYHCFNKLARKMNNFTFAGSTFHFCPARIVLCFILERILLPQTILIKYHWTSHVSWWIWFGTLGWILSLIQLSKHLLVKNPVDQCCKKSCNANIKVFQKQ